MLTKKILEMQLASLEGCQSFDLEAVAKVILDAADQSNGYDDMTDLDVLVLFAIQGFVAMEKQWRMEQMMAGRPLARSAAVH